MGLFSRSKAKTILLIDDDPGILTLLQKSLKAKGYQVFSSLRAEEGLQMAIDKQPDLIILDVMMPVVNGYNVCRLLKSEYHLQAPIILLTVRKEKVDFEIGREVGADAHLVKPVQMDVLLKTIKGFLKE